MVKLSRTTFTLLSDFFSFLCFFSGLATAFTGAILRAGAAFLATGFRGALFVMSVSKDECGAISIYGIFWQPIV
jgi:hypothetical protein